MTGGLAAALSSVYGAGNARPAPPPPRTSPVDGVTVTHAELPTAIHPVVPNRRNPYSGSPWGAPEELPPSSAYLPPAPAQPSNVVPLRRRVATGAVAAVVALLCSFGGVMLAESQVSGDPSDVLAAATPTGPDGDVNGAPSPIGDPPDSNTRRTEPKPDSYQIDSNAGNDYPVPIPEPRTNDDTPPRPSTKPSTKPPTTKPTTPSPDATTPRPTPSKTTPEPTPTEDEDDDPTTPPPDDDPTTTPPTKAPTKGPSTPPASPTVPRTSPPATIVIPA
ncbi:hypothetical protein [Cryptosporangium japonicum]